MAAIWISMVRAPASATAYMASSLISIILFIFSMFSTIPPNTGIAPSETLVPALRGVTGTTNWLASFMTAATSSVLLTQTTTSGRCIRRGSVSSSVLKRSRVSASVFTFAPPTTFFSSSSNSGVTGLYFAIQTLLYRRSVFLLVSQAGRQKI